MPSRKAAELDRDTENIILLEVLANFRGEAQEWNDYYADADTVRRAAAQRGLEMTTTGVGRRLSKLAREGKCAIRHIRGYGEYRAKCPSCYGKGSVEIPHPSGHEEHGTILAACRACGGRG